jgi:hypothetical protein
MSPNADASKAASLAFRQIAGQVGGDGGLTAEIIGSAELKKFSDPDAIAHEVFPLLSPVTWPGSQA